MCVVQTPWEKTVEFHGHACPGLALGYRAAQVALKRLGVERARDEELVAVVANDSCAVDAVQYISGCTLGKGNLYLKDYGKHVYILGRRGETRGVRVALRFGVLDGAGSWEERMEKILHAPEEELFAVKEIELPPLPAAQIYKTVQCAQCGEGVAEAKVRVADGQLLCRECYPEEKRRW